jgi:hypothetical protein
MTVSQFLPFIPTDKQVKDFFNLLQALTSTHGITVTTNITTGAGISSSNTITIGIIIGRTAVVIMAVTIIHHEKGWFLSFIYCFMTYGCCKRMGGIKILFFHFSTIFRLTQSS